MSIIFPPKSPGGQNVTYEAPERFVVVGANGAGKTRFGVFLDDNNVPGSVQRISAQKALAIPDYVEVKTLEQAEKGLSFGRYDEHASHARKLHDRFGGNAALGTLTDYDKVLGLLFALETERNRAHTAQTRESKAYVPVAESAIDRILKVWADLMPHRPIGFGDGKVTVLTSSGSSFHAKEMSDGERVVLYLLGQCLCVKPGTALVIDEPELHLHRALNGKLWDKVEQLCSDKTFVYITHDLEFAASRIGAKKIWVQSFDGSRWTWDEVPKDDFLPEALMMEVAGSRKPILFCEGERGGLDQIIYQRCFPHRHVVPRGGCEKVEESTKALKDNAALHAYDCVGIVDGDLRTDDEVAALEAHGIYVLQIAEVENLLCVEGLVALVAQALKHDPQNIVEKVATYIRTSLESELDTQIAMRSAARVRFHLSAFTATKNDASGVKSGVRALVDTLDVDRLLAESKELFTKAMSAGDLNSLLKVYNRKSLAKRISGCFGLKDDEYKELVLRMLAGSDAQAVVGVLIAHLPTV
ncbi:MAG: DUF4435 domain-containing protein [Burkholderiales bacterium]